MRQVDKKERPHHILPSKASNHTRLFELEEALAAVGAALLLAAVVAPGAVAVSAVEVRETHSPSQSSGQNYEALCWMRAAMMLVAVLRKTVAPVGLNGAYFVVVAD